MPLYRILENLQRVLQSIGVNTGDKLVSSVLIDSTGDVIRSNNFAVINQVASCSARPLNHKSEMHGGTITPVDVLDKNDLVYTINFQNTTADPVFSVFVRDTLDSKLNAASFEMIDASQPYKVRIEQGRFIPGKCLKLNCQPVHRTKQPAVDILPTK